MENHQRKGLGIIWGLVLLVILAVLATVVYVVGRPIREAKHVEQILNERFGEAPTFTPAADGAIPPERIEAFLRVRERVYPHCGAFRDRLEEVIRMDSLQDDERVPAGVKAAELLNGLKGLIRFGPVFLDFIETRNAALMEEGMGLGEYMYIYVLAYAEPLARLTDARFDAFEEARVSDRARADLTQILRNQLGLLSSAAAGGPFTATAGAPPASLEARLREQIAALTEGRQNIPWQDGLPPAVAASLAPYAPRLAHLYCEGLAKLELLQKNKGFQLEG
jgi:hypothetical protein